LPCLDGLEISSILKALRQIHVGYPFPRSVEFRPPLAAALGRHRRLRTVAGDRLLIDPDTRWQITVGQWILDHRAVPVTDVYSFTMRGQPWISTQWLAQVMYALAYAVAGWAGGAGGERHRSDLRIAGAATAPALQRQHHAGVGHRGSGFEAAASGGALPLIQEWAAADFSSLGAFEVYVLLGFGLALYRGVRLRRRASRCCWACCTLNQGRSAEVLALLGPLILADPLAEQLGDPVEPDNLFRLLGDYRIEATLLRTESAANKLLDHLDGWQKVYADDLATIHLRTPGAVHSAEPVVSPIAH
jgi:hypothetical protein